MTITNENLEEILNKAKAQIIAEEAEEIQALAVRVLREIKKSEARTAEMIGILNNIKAGKVEQYLRCEGSRLPF